MTLCNIPEGRTPHLHRGGSLKTRFRDYFKQILSFPPICCTSNHSMMWYSSQADFNALPSQHQAKASSYIRALPAPLTAFQCAKYLGTYPKSRQILHYLCIWSCILSQSYWLFLHNWTRAERWHFLFRKAARSVKQKDCFAAALGINLPLISSQQPIERSGKECVFQ